MILLLASLALLRQDPDISVRVLMARPVVRTDSREYDAGIFSTTLNLVHDADVQDRAAFAGLEVEGGGWRWSVFGGRLQGKTTLTSPFTFEEERFPGGSRLRTTFDVGWMEAVHRFRLADDGPSWDVRALLGINFTRFHFRFTDGISEAHESHPALWPVPAAGLEGRIALSDSFSLSARLLSTRIKYVNPFHKDGGSHSRIVYDFIRAEAGLEWRVTRHWTVGVALNRITNYLRDTSREDRHRVWFDCTALALSVDVRF